LTTTATYNTIDRMTSPLKGKPKNTEPYPRLNTRVFSHQEEYVKSEVKKSKKTNKPISEGELYRELIDIGIISRKKKEHVGK